MAFVAVALGSSLRLLGSETRISTGSVGRTTQQRVDSAVIWVGALQISVVGRVSLKLCPTWRRWDGLSNSMGATVQQSV